MTDPQESSGPKSHFLDVAKAEVLDGARVVADDVSDALEDADRFGLHRVKPPLSEALARVQTPSSDDAEAGGQNALTGETAEVDENAGVLKAGTGPEQPRGMLVMDDPPRKAVRRPPAAKSQLASGVAARLSAANVAARAIFDDVSILGLSEAEQQALDLWISSRSKPQPTRTEAVHQILTHHLRSEGYLPGDSSEPTPAASPTSAPIDRYADADPSESVMVTGVGPMILARAVRKRDDWREHHGLELVSVFRGADKEPGVFDMRDLVRLAELERFW